MNPDQICDECGECDHCDLDPAKPCDNCCRCLGDADYSGVIVTRIDWRNPESDTPKRNPSKDNEEGPDEAHK